jgi:hypothetical protein
MDHMRSEAGRISQSYGVGTIEWPIQQDSWPTLDLAVGAQKKRGYAEKIFGPLQMDGTSKSTPLAAARVDPKL